MFLQELLHTLYGDTASDRLFEFLEHLKTYPSPHTRLERLRQQAEKEILGYILVDTQARASALFQGVGKDQQGGSQ